MAEIGSVPAIGAVAAVVLAAGLSRRYGPDSKLHAELGGKFLALHIADTLCHMGFGHRIAVCQPDDPLGPAFRARGFDVVLNPDSGRGMASSLALGVTAAREAGSEAVLICLADMPFVSAAHLMGLVDALDGESDIVASATAVSDVPPTPPAIFGKAHFTALAGLTGDKGARSLLGEARIVVAPAQMLADFDTPDDFSATR
ncbi:MAG TPA: nucleotidyltransferase family protein [Devosiaceae bacterium]|jgi:molybdenum cofactor cytidylyltransferase